MAICAPNDNSSALLPISLRPRCDIVQNRNKMVNPDAKADIMLAHMATFVTSPPEKRLKNLVIIIKNGAPGGCPTSSL